MRFASGKAARVFAGVDFGSFEAPWGRQWRVLGVGVKALEDSGGVRGLPIAQVEELTTGELPYLGHSGGEWQCIPCGSPASRGHLMSRDHRRISAVWLLAMGYDQGDVSLHWAHSGLGVSALPSGIKWMDDDGHETNFTNMR